jgi:hypothetical protein
LAVANIPIVVQLSDDFIDRLAAAIVRAQLGGETVSTEASGSSVTHPDDDPWGVTSTGTQNPPAATTEPSRGTTAPASPPPTGVQPGVYQVNTPKGVQTWTLGLASAPLCGHGVPSAHIQGSTNGRAWARYGCAKGKDKSTFRDKCDFSEWA